MPWEAFGQADSLEVEIIWEKQFDSEVQIRPGTWPSTVAVQFLPEPYVGIEWSVPEGKNPVLSVVTQNSIYILDQDGKVTRQIALDWKERTLQDKGDSYSFQSGGVSPDGRYYVIYDKVAGWEYTRTLKAYVFTADGTPVIELSGPNAGEVMFSPNGKAIVVFESTIVTHIAFYDEKFNLIKKQTLDIDRTDCLFSADGSHVFVRWNGLLKFDTHGRKVGEITWKEFFPASNRIRILGASHERRILLRQKLREKIPSLRGKRVSLPRERFIAETKAALKSKSPERIEEITRETHIRSRQGITLSPSGRYGVFNTESTLILFKITK